MNPDRAYPALGPCEDYEFDLVELIDGAAAPERRAMVEHHLETCGRCRAFARAMIGVTESLALALPRRGLSPDFDAKLKQRIDALGPAVNKDAARARADRDYRGALASLRRGFTLRAVLDSIASASVVAGLVATAAALAPRLQPALDLVHVRPGLLSLGIGAIGLVAGVTAAFGLGRAQGLDPTR
jgi:anti-sigma factor RsiW